MEKLDKYKRWNTQLQLMNDEYWDFVLSQDPTPYSMPNGEDADFNRECLASSIDFANTDTITNTTIVSSIEWKDSINEIDGKLKDIGFTGIDNGLITFNKDIISNKEYYKILTESELDLNPYGKKFFMNVVSGNTGDYSYDYEYDLENGFIKLKGGFLQGFYKIFGKNYQTLPSHIENEWNLEFIMRPKDYNENENTLNSTHEGNKGIFFFIGNRAEKKFAQLYNSDIEKYDSDERKKEIYSGYCDADYFQFDWDEEQTKKSSKFNLISFLYSNPNNCSCVCPCSSLKYSDKNGKPKDKCDDIFIYDEYFKEEDKMDESDVKTSRGNAIIKKGYYEINTDNKYLIFDRSKNGYTVSTWDENNTMALYGYSRKNENYFLTAHRGKDGLTASEIEAMTDKYGDISEYAINNDSINSFALKIDDEGRIGYKYMVKNCDYNEETSESIYDKYTILEEMSFPNTIKKDDVLVNGQIESV